MELELMRKRFFTEITVGQALIETEKTKCGTERFYLKTSGQIDLANSLDIITFDEWAFLWRIMLDSYTTRLVYGVKRG